MSTYEEKLALREQGLTYKQIAEQLGISKQAVAQQLAKGNPKYFRKIKGNMCVYPNLRKWMNDNKVSISELSRCMGLIGFPENLRRVARYLSGEIEMRKATIDKILSVTGMTYEEAFEEGNHD